MPSLSGVENAISRRRWRVPRASGVTRRSGDVKAVKDFFSHTQDALAPALSGIARQNRRDRREAGGRQDPPRTLISGGSNV